MTIAFVSSVFSNIAIKRSQMTNTHIRTAILNPMLSAVWAAWAMLFAFCGCDSVTDDSGVAEGNTDADTDNDTDSDTDGDLDSDTDANNDSDTDTDSDVDTFDVGACPAIDSADRMIRYVDANVSTPGTGVSWAEAFADIQDGIDACRCAALALNASCQVWVAAGTYTTDQGNRRDTVRLRPLVELFGGFSGNETSREERDWEVNVTRLDGGGTAYHVVTGADDATIDGFTISGGIADGTGGGGDLHGAGMYNVSVSPRVANCTFRENATYWDDWGCWLSCELAGFGGGMYNENASPTVVNSTFAANKAQVGGGGMANVAGSAPTVTACTFDDNRSFGGSLFTLHYSGYGGGMYNDGSSPSVTECTFSNNSTIFGGGMYNTASSPVVSRCSFEGNTAYGFNGDAAQWYGSGGGMYNIGGAPVVENSLFTGNLSDNSGGGMSNVSSSPLVRNCVFTENASFSMNYYSGRGGGMFNDSAAEPLVTGCRFSGNTAGWGGGMYNFREAMPTIANCIFEGNLANGYCNSISSGCGGGGMYNHGASPKMVNCAFANNAVDPYNEAEAYGGGILNTMSSPTVTNCILWGNTADGASDQIYTQEMSAPSISYSDVQGGCSMIADAVCGDGNIDAAPLFVNADAGDGAGDFRLQVGSPCIDTGLSIALPADAFDIDGDGDTGETLPYDLDGKPRIVGVSVDMGAFEYQQ